MMTLHSKQLIDYWIGTPICLILNLLARILGFAMKRNHSISKHPKVIVLSKYQGIGSVINALPLVHTLRKHYPSARIIFITTNGPLQILRLCPDVDQIFVINDDKLLSLMWNSIISLFQLWKLKPDLFIDLEIFSKFSSIITTLSCARNRVGFYLESTLFRKGLYTHLIYFNRFQHIQEIYGRVGHLFGVTGKEPRASEILNVTDHSDVEAKRFLTEVFGSVGDFLIVNPNAGSLCLERRWPPEKMAELIEDMAGDGLNIVLIGSPQERDFVESIYQKIPSDVLDHVAVAAGRLSFSGVIALLRIARLMITNDSGPFHLAILLGIPTVSLWGPMSQKIYGPLHGAHIAIEGLVYCHPCLHMVDRPPCLGHNICMQSIQVQQVLKAVKLILSKDAPAEPVVWHSTESASDPEYIPGVVILRETLSKGQG